MHITVHYVLTPAMWWRLDLKRSPGARRVSITGYYLEDVSYREQLIEKKMAVANVPSNFFLASAQGS